MKRVFRDVGHTNLHLRESLHEIHRARFGDFGARTQLTDAALPEDATDGKLGPDLGLGDI